jgi:hypothetical protein
MFCHSQPEATPEQVGGTTTGSEGTGKSHKKYGALAGLAIGAAAIAPHSLCLLGGLSVLGVTGWGIHSACSTPHTDDANSSHGVEITRLESLPQQFTELPKDRSMRAAALLLEVEPRFQDIIDAKVAEAGGTPIEMVFLDSADGVTVVVCKNGGLCPCSEPQAYLLGQREDVVGTEKFPGQFRVLQALYGE